MKFVLKPSLEHLALVKIVVYLWSQNDVKGAAAHLFCFEREEHWELVEEIVKNKVPQLSLPDNLICKVRSYIDLIGLEVLKWMKFHYTHFDFPTHYLPAELCWTPQGTVDRKRTAEVLVRNENVNVATRYRLACIYCLEEDIIHFRKRMPEILKEYYYYWDNFPIIIFWSRNIKGWLSLISYESEFLQCVKDGNIVAAEYFLQKLTPQERGKSLVEAAKHIKHATLNTKHVDILCLLLSEIEEHQQMEVFKNYPYTVLTCFLQFPWQNFFIEMANRMWDFLSEEKYGWLLEDIMDKSRQYKDYNYQKLFGEFWQESPSALKSFILNEIDKSSLLPSLFHESGKENIRLILKDATLATREKLIYSGNMDFHLDLIACYPGWNLIEFFIRECFPSKNEILKFKTEFEKRMMHQEHFARRKHRWDRFFSMITEV